MISARVPLEFHWRGVLERLRPPRNHRNILSDKYSGWVDKVRTLPIFAWPSAEIARLLDVA